MIFYFSGSDGGDAGPLIDFGSCLSCLNGLSDFRRKKASTTNKQKGQPIKQVRKQARNEKKKKRRRKL